MKNVIETKYNSSLLNYKPPIKENIIDFILESYFHRDGKAENTLLLFLIWC